MTEPAYPPCPTCDDAVLKLIASGGAEDRRLGCRETTVLQARTPFTLLPCGHEVRQYTVSDDRVTKWDA